MKLAKYLSLYLIFLIVWETGVAQHYSSINYTINDGLPSNAIYAIFKDSRGLLWIGTEGGLCSFDGKKFKIFNSTDGLVGDKVRSITEDHSGNLWIACMNAGISCFNGKKFTNFKKAEGLVSKDVRIIWYSKRFDKIFIGTDDGVSVKDGAKFISCNAKTVGTVFEKMFITGFLENNESVSVYSYGISEPLKYYPTQKRFEIPKQLYTDKPSTSVSPLILQNGDTMMGDRRKGIVILSKRPKQSFDKIGQVFSLAQGEQGEVWIAGWADNEDKDELYGGLYKYTGRTVERFSEKVGIKDRAVWTVYYDTTFHLLWVGTLTQGLFRIPEPLFSWYNASDVNVPALRINSLFFHKGNIWIGAKGYLIRKDSQDHFFTFSSQRIMNQGIEAYKEFYPKRYGYLLDENGSLEKYQNLIENGKYPYPNPYIQIMEDLGTILFPPPKSKYSPSFYRKQFNDGLRLRSTLPLNFFSFAKDSKGELFVSGIDLYQIDLISLNKIGKVLSYPTGVRSLAFTSEDSLYFGYEGNKGIYVASLTPKVRFPKSPWYGEKKNGCPNPVKIISKGNEVWLASKTEGLFHMKNGISECVNNKLPQLPKTITDFCFDQQGNIIIGSSNGNIYIVKNTKSDLRVSNTITQIDGLIGNSIGWLLVDKENILYAATNLGLNIIDLKPMYASNLTNIKYFDEYQGYFDKSGKSATLDDKGNIWVGTDQHLLRIDVSLLKSLCFNSQPLKIEKVEVSNAPFIIGADTAWENMLPEDYKFSYSQNSLTFFYRSINYLSPNNFHYKYRLYGLKDQWTSFSEDNRAVFTSLRPARYKLSIEYYNQLDNSKIYKWNYGFIINSPFYTRWWFILLVLMIIISVTYTFYRIRINEIRKQEQHKAHLMRELSLMEMRGLQAQMNPHFIFNAINSIQSFILSSDIDRALQYLTTFSQLIRKTLENAMKEHIKLSEELEYLRFYVEIEKMRFNDRFNYSILIDPEVSTETTLIPPMLIQPFIENAIKHGQIHKIDKGMIALEIFKTDEDLIKFIIQDNGVGRDRERKNFNPQIIHNSKGILLIEERLSLLNTSYKSEVFKLNIIDLKDSNNSPTGTRVEITFPLIRG